MWFGGFWLATFEREETSKYGMTVEAEVLGWVKVKWDYGQEESCRVGAQGPLGLSGAEAEQRRYRWQRQTQKIP